MEILDVHQELRAARGNMKVLTLKFKAENTLKSYESYFKQFCSWCRKYNFISVPAKDTLVALYLSWLKQSNPSESKINSVTYSISWAHNVAGFADPCSSVLVRNVKEGLARTCGRPAVSKTPIKVTDLQNMVKHFGSNPKIHYYGIVELFRLFKIQRMCRSEEIRHCGIP